MNGQRPASLGGFIDAPVMFTPSGKRCRGYCPPLLTLDDAAEVCESGRWLSVGEAASGVVLELVSAPLRR